MRVALFLLVVFLAVGCQSNPDFYQGPPEGKKVALHLQSGFNGERIEILYNKVPLYQGNPKTKQTLGMAEIVHFTIGPEAAGELRIRSRLGESIETITWEKGTHIGVSLGLGNDAKVRWKQEEKPFMYD